MFEGCQTKAEGIFSGSATPMATSAKGAVPRGGITAEAGAKIKFRRVRQSLKLHFTAQLDVA